jgi:hypothetical protein
MVEFKIPQYTFSKFSPLERITEVNRSAVMDEAKCTDRYLATLIIGARSKPSHPERLENLEFLLKWIDHYYGDLFDVLLVEQDSEQRIDLKSLAAKHYVRHAFLFNPKDYNRGWGYNTAVLNHCDNVNVVALMDTDVLPGPNFVKEIIDCHGDLAVSSPYMNIYYTDQDEAKKVMQTMDLAHLNDASKIKNPVTVSGGIVIWKRSSYISVKGFEQYIGYGAEDRAMDVTIFNHLDPKLVRIAPATYVHMHHDIDKDAKKNTALIFKHLKDQLHHTNLFTRIVSMLVVQRRHLL